MARPPRTWKAVERAVARLLGGRRCHFEQADVDAAGFSVEVKHGQQIPRTLLKWWEQARENARDGKTPLLVLHPVGAKYEDSLAVIRLDDLVELLSKVSVATERAANETANKSGQRPTRDDPVPRAVCAPTLPASSRGPANDGPQPQNSGERGPVLAEQGRSPRSAKRDPISA